MNCRYTLGTTLAVALLAGGVLADGPKSGPQAGEPVPGVFHPLNVTGSAAGKRVCQI